MYEMWLNLLIFGVFAFLIQSCHASSKLPQPESWAFMSPSLNHWVLEVRQSDERRLERSDSYCYV